MATIDLITANILAAVPELTSSTNTDLYKKIAEAIAISLDNTSTEMSNTKKIIDDTIANLRYGKGRYYIEKALAYQEGDSLSINSTTLEPYYETIDTNKQIIVQASFEDLVNAGLHSLVLKVAKKDNVNNVLEELTTAQLSAFISYMLNFQIVGLPLNITSLPANELSFDSIITYYASYDLTTIQEDVIAMMYDFRDNFVFDGLFYINDLESYLKTNVAGIRNVTISNTTLDGTGFSNKASLTAGYFDYISTIDENLTYEAI